MQIATPTKSVLDINSVAHIRFIAASVLPRSVLLWEPTRITGMGKFSNIKDKAAEVIAKVSVPWPIIIPSTPFFISLTIASLNFL